MTDFGTTGIQVAPKAPTEDEMNTVQDILKRAINSLVGMSQLQADVDMLRSTVQSLQADTERLRQQNAGLDEALYQARTTRNDLTSRLSQAEQDRDQAMSNAHIATNKCDELMTQVKTLQDALHSAEQQRDNAELHCMELEDQLKASEDKLAAIREGYASIFGMEHPASSVVQAPEPAPVPVPVPEPLPQAAPVAEPDSAGARNPLLPDWAEGYIWDYERKAYVKSKPDEPDGAAMPF